MTDGPGHDTVDLARALVRRPSVTPEDGGCQALIAERLRRLGFAVESLRFGEVDNLWARRGERAPLLVLAGHTDVVPTGPRDAWRVDPFAAAVEDGRLYGRGAADMKGSLAAMVTACERFLTAEPDHRGSIGFLLTSDEEGPAVDGTACVVDTLASRGVVIDWCVVGEPSSSETVGDVIRNGRRGSLNGRLVVRGRQGHVAYPQDAVNPIHGAVRALTDLVEEEWDRGSEDFPPTSFQVSNIRSGTGATNVVPGELEADFNLRYSDALTEAGIRHRVEAILDRQGLDCRVDWHHSGRPFVTPRGELVDAVTRAIRRVRGFAPELSTSGGTSDGRFIAPTGAQVVELGPVNATIHQIDEWVDVDELAVLADVYEAVLAELLGAGEPAG